MYILICAYVDFKYCHGASSFTIDDIDIELDETRPHDEHEIHSPGGLSIWASAQIISTDVIRPVTIKTTPRAMIADSGHCCHLQQSLKRPSIT